MQHFQIAYSARLGQNGDDTAFSSLDIHKVSFQLVGIDGVFHGGRLNHAVPSNDLHGPEVFEVANSTSASVPDVEYKSGPDDKFVGANDVPNNICEHNDLKRVTWWQTREILVGRLV